jgi:hypothetical protein
MRLLKVLVALAILCGSMVPLSTAKMEYSKKEGQKCSYCHTGAPSAKTINDVGKCYQANGHSLAKCAPAPAK